MSVFIDTSALIALLDRSEPEHGGVLRAWKVGNENADGFVATNYVALESVSVCRRRWGLKAVAALVEDFFPLVGLLWVGKEDHDAAIEALLTTNRRQLSLVDCVSFTVMRRLGIREFLALDPHFAEQGFKPFATPGAPG